MLMGVDRLADLSGPRCSGLTGLTRDQVVAAVNEGDTAALATTGGHFAAVSREGQKVRLARTIGIPLRYFVAKMYHGPFLAVADRIDSLYDWCEGQGIGWQFDPLYTRMVPAHYLLELEQVGCPDPSPRCTRFFEPPAGQGPRDLDELGEVYARAALDSCRDWLAEIPEDAEVGVLFSGGLDSGSILLLAREAMRSLGRSPDLLRAFTLDLGAGADAAQAEQWVNEMGLADQWTPIRLPGEEPDYEEAIRVIEDYHPLDVECAAASLLLLGELRAAHPGLQYLLDGDGGDENLKSYPAEDSDLTISSILNNPLLYQEGWGIDAIKHSPTYSGGLSRAYVRTYAPARHHGFDAFSPYSTRASIAAALRIPFAELCDGDLGRLYELKGEVVRRGVEAVCGTRMPVFPKRRFQDGAGGESYRRWRVSKAWCRSRFLDQWNERLKKAWEPEAERVSGNAIPGA